MTCPPCPTCGATATKNGHDNNGSQKYRCKGSSSHSFSDSTGKPAGHPGNPNSPGALRVARHRAAKAQASARKKNP